jgi:hypothetical protein
MCFQIQKIIILDCFINGSNFFGLLKKDLPLRSMILNFDFKIFIQMEWYLNKIIFIQVQMVILLLFFMNIICVQIPSEKIHKASMNDKPCEMGCKSKIS